MIRWLKRLFGAPVNQAEVSAFTEKGVVTSEDAAKRLRLDLQDQDGPPSLPAAQEPPPLSDGPFPDPSARPVPVAAPKPPPAVPEPKAAVPRNAGAKPAPARKSRAPRRHK